MNALETRRIHPDFAEGPRLRQLRQGLGIDLEADVFLDPALAIHLVEIGSKRRPDHLVESEQDPVFIQAGDRFQRTLEQPIHRHHLA